MVPHEGEPAGGRWRVMPLEGLARLLLDAGEAAANRPAGTPELPHDSQTEVVVAAGRSGPDPALVGG